MLRYDPKSRLPLGPAIRRYWPFLLGIPIFHILVVFVPAISSSSNLVSVLFLVALLPAMYPLLLGSAPFSYWAIAMLYWFFGYLITILLKAVLYALLGLES
jgi:hypothetical protein